ncbi:MAG: nucleic acid-binding protein [Methanobrevibacter sp.]|uniref:nucleic acid-binding protein n=1 Tax=Methanobrevibacter sp. TaxID=66852 RepID=UPI0025FC5345|nr:nucleic acid-binding protein [Methanobrevibacter sp.]MBQ6099688.1 nucleic acid-binding protein [Methanobrevibacter sp.]
MSDKEIFYDTDCLSSFISINDVTILKEMFEKVIIPYEVYEEFSRVIILKKRIDDLHYEGFLEIRDFDVESESYTLFLKLCDGEFTGRKIGDGEAAAITLAVENNGILASNNTRDINDAVKHFNLTRIRTGDILVKAFNCDMITEKEGNEIWNKMLNQKRYLTEKSFSDYLKKYPKTLF